MIAAALKSVLVVDDEESMRRTLADILAEEGYRVSTASDGLSAVRMCQEAPFDVIVMDVRLGGIDGLETVRRIRRHRDKTRVLMMSAYGSETIRNTAITDGAVAFLDKPLDIDRLLALVGTFLEDRDEDVPGLDADDE